MKIILALFLVFNISEGLSQVTMRDVLVTADTIQEINTIKKKFEISELIVLKGLRMNIVDSPFRIFYFNEITNNKLNGIHFEFYIPSGMPKEKGAYLDNEKNGEWYYWNEKGQLVRREVWDKGKLLKVKL